MEIKTGENSSVRVERQDKWIVLWVNDGCSATTLSLDSQQAFDIATLLKGCGVSAAFSAGQHIFVNPLDHEQTK